MKDGLQLSYLFVVGSEQRVLLQQQVLDSLGRSEAVMGLRTWLARLQPELQGCHISEAEAGMCPQWKQHPSLPPESLCWHGLTALWQGHVAALRGMKNNRLYISCTHSI